MTIRELLVYLSENISVYFFSSIQWCVDGFVHLIFLEILDLTVGQFIFTILIFGILAKITKKTYVLNLLKK